jgi:hypothetical protein
LWWWRGSTPNFGDELTWLLLERITGRRTVRRPLEECDLVGIGSHLEKVYIGLRRNRPLVLGSGFLEEGPAADPIGLPVLAVRGRRTSDRMPDAPADVLLGDPGLLAPELLGLGHPAVPHRDVVVIPHAMHVGTQFIEACRSDTRISVIDPKASPLDTIASVRSARFVYASGLHGLILADSLGIPNAWVSPGPELYGGTNKFADYYSSFGVDRTPTQVADLGADLVGFAKKNVDNKVFLPPHDLVEAKQHRLLGLFEDCRTI